MKICLFVMPAWIAGIQIRKDASGDIHVNLDSSTPCWNDAIEGSANVTEARPARIFKGERKGRREKEFDGGCFTSLQNSITPTLYSVLLAFLAKQSQAFQHRAIGHGEHDRRLFSGIVFELVPIPGGNKKAVFGSPAQVISNGLLLADARDAFASDDVIDGAAGVTLRLSRYTGWDELRPAADGRHGGPAGEWVSIFE
jgi:hypothetical protein